MYLEYECGLVLVKAGLRGYYDCALCLVDAR
jgi:hypothetical protein